MPDLMIKGGHGYRMVTDYLGSVRAVVDTANGTVAQRIDYDAWGVRTTDTAPTFQALGYAGGLTDSATALVRFGARDYEPGVGRWCQKDPVRYSGDGLNLYEYVESNPIDSVDPLGLESNNVFAQLTKHYTPAGGSVRGTEPPSAWTGEWWAGEAAGSVGVSGTGQPPMQRYCPYGIDIDAVLVCGQWFKIRGPVIIIGCTVIPLAPWTYVRPMTPNDEFYQDQAMKFPDLFPKSQ